MWVDWSRPCGQIQILFRGFLTSRCRPQQEGERCTSPAWRSNKLCGSSDREKKVVSGVIDRRFAFDPGQTGAYRGVCSRATPSVHLRHSSLQSSFSQSPAMFLRILSSPARRAFLFNGSTSIRFNREFRFLTIGSLDVPS